jgi:DNA-directed RNA polymerase alpha subunit
MNIDDARSLSDKDSLDKLMELSIDVLEFSLETLAELRTQKINTVYDLVIKTESTLLDGSVLMCRKKVREVKVRLYYVGLELQDEE